MLSVMKRLRKKILLANLALFATVSFWGLSFTSAKYVLNTGFPPLTLAFLRFLLASAIVFPLQRPEVRKERIEKKTFLPLLSSSLFGITLYFFFENQGIKLTSASNASLVIACIPVFTILAEFFLNKTAVGPWKILGIACSVGGVYLIVSSGIEAKLYPGVIKGNIFMICACLCWTGYIMTSSRLKKLYTGIRLLFFQFTFGTCLLLPLALVEYRRWIFPGAVGVLGIVYLGAVCSALGYYLYLYGLSKLVRELARVPVPPNRGIVGDRIFHVESGIITSWVKNVGSDNLLEAFPFRPEYVGQSGPEIVLGKGSGLDSVLIWLDKTGFGQASEEQMLEIPEEELCQAARDFFTFELELDGGIVTPSAICIRWGLIRGAPGYGPCGHIEFIYEFPAGFFAPGIHLLVARWSYKSDAELGLFAESEEDLNPLLPLTGSLVLTVLP